MPLEANLFYGGSSSPSSSRAAAGRPKRPLAYSTETTASPSSSRSTASTSPNMHTPSPSRTSRIPPPPPASPTPSSSRSRSNGSGSRRRPASTTKTSPDKFKLHFQGRVYRPFAATSPASARKLYSPSQGLLGQPDELVRDADAIIDCPCTRNIDDSTLMIQCDECEIWLHARCVGFEYEEQCPDVYLCRKCAPSASAGKRNSSTIASERLRETTPEPDITNTTYPGARPSPPPSSSPYLSDSEDGGLEVEVPVPLNSSPLNRTPTRTPTKRTPISPSQYAISRNLPAEFANASPIVKASPSHPLLTPSKRNKADICETAGAIPQTHQQLKKEEMSLHDAHSVPLPDHYAALLNLHAAVERALLLHLATEGSKACSAAVATPASDSATSTSSGNSETLVVDLPNLATFTGIRAVVERGSGRRFGPTELAQLVWLWEGGLNGPQASEEDDLFTSSDSMASRKKEGRRGGLSMTVSSTRELDRNSGKRVHTWGIGIHLELKQNVQLPALELVGSSPSSSSSRQGALSSLDSPATPALKRVGMSVLPLWSSKAEYRREEMRRRLGECVLKAHDDFSSRSTHADPHSPSKKKRLSDSFRETVMLPPTPPPSNRKRTMSSITSHGFVKGFILDALPPIPAASLPQLGPSSTGTLSLPSLANSKSSGIANADVADIAREERAEMMPSTRDTTTRPAMSTTEDKRQSLLNGTKIAAPKAPVEQRAMSLLDRVSCDELPLLKAFELIPCFQIKAKEAAQMAAKESQASASGNDSLMMGKNLAKKTSHSAARMSLEAASVRAKKKASQKLL